MRIKSVKVLRDRVSVAWETPVGEQGEMVESAIKNGQDPTPELANSIAALKDDACDMLEFPKAYRDTFTMKGVSVTYGPDGDMGVTFIGSKQLKSGRTTTICTPEMKERTSAEDKGSSAFLSEEQAGRVSDVLTAAEAFAKGARAQTTLKIEP